MLFSAAKSVLNTKILALSDDFFKKQQESESSELRISERKVQAKTKKQKTAKPRTQSFPKPRY